MPSKKKKYNARFPAGRIKKIMQTDEEIGKVAQAVPVIISRTLELFVESLLKKAMQITCAKNAKTLTPTHMKQCILSESRFDFLKDLVKGVPDVSSLDDDFGTQCGNKSPSTPLSSKLYNCFQFQQPSDSGSSRSPSVASQPPILQTSQPKFYKEIPIGSEDFENKVSENTTQSLFSGSSVIQHTGTQISNNYSSTVPFKSSEEFPSLLKNMSGRNITQLNELKLSNCSKTSDIGKLSSEREKNVGVKKKPSRAEDLEEKEEEEEDECDEKFPGENGYHNVQSDSKQCVIDEDYDT